MREAVSFSSSVIEIIQRRYSCRNYREIPIESEKQRALSDFLAMNRRGPLGSQARFSLIAAVDQDVASLKGLGTYGFIKNAKGFFVGAVEEGPKFLEDFGYLQERIILRATDLGLGTCWLGGSFSKSAFAKKIALAPGERMPAVVAVGYADEGKRDKDFIRKSAGAATRLPAEKLFFEGEFGKSLSPQAAGPYAKVLECVRWAPSASNRQPWRLLRTETGWHFYLARSKNYGKGTLVYNLLHLADLQRVDMGIAMCHWEFTARELALDGGWTIEGPALPMPERTEYIVTWRPK